MNEMVQSAMNPILNQSSLEAPLESTKAPQRTLALIKPDAYGAGKKQEILDLIKSDGFTIVKETELRMTFDQAKDFYQEHLGKPFYEKLTSWMSSAPIYAMILEKESGITSWRTLAGPTNSLKARETAPESIRARFGTDGSQNAVHGSDSEASALREIGIIFGQDALDEANGRCFDVAKFFGSIFLRYLFPI